MKNKKIKTTTNKSLNKKAIKNLIYGIFANNPTKVFNYKQLSTRIGISKSAEKQMVLLVLSEMYDLKIIEEVEKGRYKLNSPKSSVTGIVEIINNGSARLNSEELNSEIFISNKNLNHALNGDTVRVLVYAHRKKGTIEGEVTEIINRKQSSFVGTIELSHGFGFLVPDGKALQTDIFIPPGSLKDIKNGQKAIAKITDWPARSKNPIGEIIEVLGFAGEHNVEMNAIMAEYELPLKFPEAVEKEAENIPVDISETEIKNRKDVRNILTFTIDPFDAKDFDDAISIEYLKNGNYSIGVHIADVTHYVQENSLIENEAANRATSVYLVDRVIPMLPEKLSNFICSLRPNEDKLCFSAIFEIDNDGEIINEWFGKTIINSNYRFTYEQAQETIETGKGDIANEINLLNDIAKKIRAKRFISGAIGFERAEIKFLLDDKGKPIKVLFKESKEAHKLIEEFMLLANKQVAEYAGKVKDGQNAKTFVYRIHDRPDEEKLRQFAGFIKQFGYKIKIGTNKTIANSMNSLLSELKGKAEKDMIENLAIRAMAKAQYSTKNIGHYGLSFSYYSHFTSPIRRYPDMMAHRLLLRYLEGGHSVKPNKYEDLCKHSSLKENKAAEAERASVKYKQAEFLSDKLNIPFDGVISGVTEWGLYVQITENYCEGMVSLRNMDDDFYIFDEDKFLIYGRYSNKKYRLGDKVKIIVHKVNMQKRHIDMKIINE